MNISRWYIVNYSNVLASYCSALLASAHWSFLKLLLSHSVIMFFYSFHFCTKKIKKSRALKLGHHFNCGMREYIWQSSICADALTLITPPAVSTSFKSQPDLLNPTHNLIFVPQCTVCLLTSSKLRTSQLCFEIRKLKKVSVFGRVRNYSSINTVW